MNFSIAIGHILKAVKQQMGRAVRQSKLPDCCGLIRGLLLIHDWRFWEYIHIAPRTWNIRARPIFQEWWKLTLFWLIWLNLAVPYSSGKVGWLLKPCFTLCVVNSSCRMKQKQYKNWGKKVTYAMHLFTLHYKTMWCRDRHHLPWWSVRRNSYNPRFCATTVYATIPERFVAALALVRAGWSCVITALDTARSVNDRSGIVAYTVQYLHVIFLWLILDHLILSCSTAQHTR